MTRERLIERTIGAVLVSAFCFVVYSIFLDAETQDYIDRSTQIPAMPEFVEPLEIDDVQIVIEAPKKNTETIFIPTEEVSPQEIAESPVIQVTDVSETKTLEPNDETAKEERLSLVIEDSDQREDIINESQKAVELSPNAWVIQVGSFSGIEKADGIVNQLLKKSYKAYYRDLARDNLYRVF